MEEPTREGDCRVPLISSIFCVSLTTGGVLLVMYVFTPSISEPWYPIAAFVLIGAPWIFWIFTYLYTCMKACYRCTSLDERQVSRRTTRGRSRSATLSNNATMARNGSSVNDQPPPAVNSPRDGKHVQFAGVVVMDSKNNSHQGHQDHHDGGQISSVNSSRECEMPLNLGVSSS